MFEEWWGHFALDVAVIVLAATLGKLAAHVREHLDMELVYRVMGLEARY